MPKQIIIAEQHHIAAVFREDQIQELVVATGRHQIGDIYLGVVENVLPGIDALFHPFASEYAISPQCHGTPLGTGNHALRVAGHDEQGNCLHPASHAHIAGIGTVQWSTVKSYQLLTINY